MDALYHVKRKEKESILSAHTGRLLRGAANRVPDVEQQFHSTIGEVVGRFVEEGSEKKTLGGVAVVPLICAAQLLWNEGAEVYFYANLANDADGDELYEMIGRTPLRRDKISRRSGRCPVTYVLNEESGESEAAERTFIAYDEVGPGLRFAPADLDEAFYGSDVTLFSAMFWEPDLSSALSKILGRCKQAGSLTVAGTAFDPGQRHNAGRWHLGDSDEVYRHIDLLVMNHVEAGKYAGTSSDAEAAQFFRAAGVDSVIITNGLEPVYYASAGQLFAKESGYVPVASAVLEDQRSGRIAVGDTVGCGDNFVGGVLASITSQKRAGRSSLREAVRWGNVAGALASTHRGGVHYERRPGERRTLFLQYLARYTPDH